MQYQLGPISGVQGSINICKARAIRWWTKGFLYEFGIIKLAYLRQTLPTHIVIF